MTRSANRNWFEMTLHRVLNYGFPSQRASDEESAPMSWLCRFPSRFRSGPGEGHHRRHFRSLQAIDGVWAERRASGGQRSGHRTCQKGGRAGLCGEFFFYLTHWGRDKMDAISQTTFSNAFSLMKMYEFRLRFHWSLFIRSELTIYQHWFR